MNEEYRITYHPEYPAEFGFNTDSLSAKNINDLYRSMLQSGIRFGNIEGSYYDDKNYGLGYDFAWGKGKDGYKNILNAMVNTEDGKCSLEGTYYHNFSPNAQAYIGGKPREIWAGMNFKI